MCGGAMAQFFMTAGGVESCFCVVGYQGENLVEMTCTGRPVPTIHCQTAQVGVGGIEGGVDQDRLLEGFLGSVDVIGSNVNKPEGVPGCGSLRIDGEAVQQ